MRARGITLPAYPPKIPKTRSASSGTGAAYADWIDRRNWIGYPILDALDSSSNVYDIPQRHVALLEHPVGQNYFS